MKCTEPNAAIFIGAGVSVIHGLPVCSVTLTTKAFRGPGGLYNGSIGPDLFHKSLLVRDLKHRKEVMKVLSKMMKTSINVEAAGNVLGFVQYLGISGLALHCYSQNIDNLEAMVTSNIGYQKENYVIQYHGTAFQMSCLSASCTGVWHFQKEYFYHLDSGEDMACQSCIKLQSSSESSGNRASSRPKPPGIGFPMIYLTHPNQFVMSKC